MSNLKLLFTRQDLDGDLSLRAGGLTSKTVTWLKKSAEFLWNSTKGVVSISTMHSLRGSVLTKYQDTDAKHKNLQFARAFLRYLAKISFDQRYASFELYLEMPKAVKTRKHVTSRIVTKEDVENVLKAIEQAHRCGKLDTHHYLNYTALVLFGGFTGQRSLSTIARLTVGQFREAVVKEKPVVDVLPWQDKIRMQHYCPLHPQVVKTIVPALENRRDDELVFEQLTFQLWLRHNDIRLKHGNIRIVNGDLRKFAEQHGDVIGWEQSNRAYILTHGVSGVDWKHYKHPLPEHMYDVYMRYWREVRFDV